MEEVGIGARVLGKPFSGNDIQTDVKVKRCRKKEKEFRRRKQFLEARTQYVSSSIRLGWKALGGK